MTSFNQRECRGCGQPCDGFYYYLCTCQQCGVNLLDGTCLNCTYGDGKPVTCCGCEGPLKDLKIISKELAEFIYSPSWNRPTFYDVDDDEYTIIYRPSKAITPDLSIEEPDNSLSMGNEHLSTILETKSDKVIKSSVENLVPIPRESECVFDDTCDVPFCVNSPLLDVLNDHFEIFSDSNNDCTSSDNDSFKDIDYIKASPPEDFIIMGNEELSTIPKKESDEL
ncbi:hypothetical protein Tco_0679013 [Tanacetum coccineum]|uniref:Uncharacterized protein n=1 Tax=Tanacetum coccineum TaxID=301880 RepID=A0ABQ4XGN8_9ASTR